VTISDQSKLQPLPAVDLISVPEAALRIGLHVDTLYRLCRQGQFPPAIQIGARWRVSVPRLERYLHADSRQNPSIGDGVKKPAD
jgi:excisionase family DNA binding protein